MIYRISGIRFPNPESLHKKDTLAEESRVGDIFETDSVTYTLTGLNPENSKLYITQCNSQVKNHKDQDLRWSNDMVNCLIEQSEKEQERYMTGTMILHTNSFYKLKIPRGENNLNVYYKNILNKLSFAGIKFDSDEYEKNKFKKNTEEKYKYVFINTFIKSDNCVFTFVDEEMYNCSTMHYEIEGILIHRNPYSIVILEKTGTKKSIENGEANMAKVKNKVIDFIDGDKTITSINTKRLNAVYIQGKLIKFVFNKQTISSAEFNSNTEVEKVKRNFMKEWRGIE